jgi:DeoR/GlpR family transcriptional regulator of sugar metabolism
MPDQAKAIMTQLAIDGRRSYAELAERADTSPTTARRCVNDLLCSGILLLRTDVSAQDAGWPVETAGPKRSFHHREMPCRPCSRTVLV